MLTGFFYNPNIHPLEEFEKRLSAVKKLSTLMELDVILSEEYAPEPFFDGLKEGVSKDKRCPHCYSIRLQKTAEAAKERGFDFFSSSLLYSRFQDHNLIVSQALTIEKMCGIPFYYEDFRQGWKLGIETSKAMGLYRQIYCGCIFSKMERNIRDTAQNG